jgi:hypothetical protein
LTYKVSFEIQKARYWSTLEYRSSDFSSQTNENDRFSAHADYADLTLPRHGSASKIDLKAHAEGTDPIEGSGDPEWENYGHATSSDGSSSFHCQGDLQPGAKAAELHAGPARVNGHDDLSLQVAVTGGFVVAQATGSHPPTGCQYFNGFDAFYPANKAYMPGMLTANINVRLSELRAMKVGQEQQAAGLIEQNASTAPPSDCSEPGSGTTCTQHLDWKGRLVFKRTG